MCRWWIRHFLAPHAQSAPPSRWWIWPHCIRTPIIVDKKKTHAYQYNFHTMDKLSRTLPDLCTAGKYVWDNEVSMSTVLKARPQPIPFPSSLITQPQEKGLQIFELKDIFCSHIDIYGFLVFLYTCIHIPLALDQIIDVTQHLPRLPGPLLRISWFVSQQWLCIQPWPHLCHIHPSCERGFCAFPHYAHWKRKASSAIWLLDQSPGLVPPPQPVDITSPVHLPGTQLDLRPAMNWLHLQTGGRMRRCFRHAKVLCQAGTKTPSPQSSGLTEASYTRWRLC